MVNGVHPRRAARYRRILTVFLCLLGMLLCSLHLSRDALWVTRYTLPADIPDAIRVVQLSDLHNEEFGRDNRRLIRNVAKQEPDLIFLTGDLMHNWYPDLTATAALLEALAEIAPVYYALGNHEDAQRRRFATDFEAIFGESVTILDFETDVIDIRGIKVAVGGLFGQCFIGALESEELYLNALAETDADLRLLLCHHPHAWVNCGAAEYWNDFDAVFTGHNHGGQVIFPFIGGLISPDGGYFPGKVWGLYEKENASPVIVSRGLGSASYGVRLNNIPEIVVCDIGGT